MGSSTLFGLCFTINGKYFISKPAKDNPSFFSKDDQRLTLILPTVGCRGIPASRHQYPFWRRDDTRYVSVAQSGAAVDPRNQIKQHWCSLTNRTKLKNSSSYITSMTWICILQLDTSPRSFRSPTPGGGGRRGRKSWRRGLEAVWIFAIWVWKWRGVGQTMP